MLLNTPVHFEDQATKYDYNSRFSLLGSCFSDEIGGRLRNLKIPSLVNPFGTIFNPISLFNALEKNKSTDETLIIQSQDLFFHYDYHSSFFGYSKEEVLDKIQKAKESKIKFLESTDVLILTLGTAFVHELKDSNTIVSNCHKQPSQLFHKRLLSVEEITSQFDSIYHNIHTKTQIVLNISPVRHTKDGMAGNQLSKSTLRVACSIIESKYKNVSYLPTYEKMIDDLRDYRFYKEDLIHPNNQSVEIIFKEFSNSFFTKKAIALMQEVKTIQISLNHRTLFDKSMSHQQFLSNLKAQITELNKEIDLSSELQKIEELIG